MRMFEQIKQLPVSKNHITWVLVGSFALISACSSHRGSQVRVVDKTHTYNNQIKVSSVPLSGQYPSTPNAPQGKYVVQQGETLYSLAFRYGRDWRDLAQSNNIKTPYTIYPGQVIYFSGAPSVYVKPTKPAETPKTTVNKTPPPVKKPVTVTQAVVGGWTWPATGTVVNTFSTAGSVNKGVDIAGNEGDSIVAASSGVVVYAGNNLRGYGELLIVKHNDSFVSAYAHNRRLLVKEGQKVSAGQKIAEMGSTGTDRVKLHFEIRKNGKPVNPVGYLPKR